MNAIVGYLASVFLGVSLLMNNDLKFRWINSLGCITFVVYGIMLGAWPIIVTNSALLVINIIYLFKIYNRNEESFDIVPYQPNDELVQKFLAFYKKDISLYYPQFQQQPANVRFLVLRDMAIANIFEASVKPDGTGVVLIDYTIPRFRDFKVGKFIFDKGKQYLTGHGIQTLEYRVDNKDHRRFLQSLGFQRQQDSSLRKALG